MVTTTTTRRPALRPWSTWTTSNGSRFQPSGDQLSSRIKFFIRGFSSQKLRNLFFKKNCCMLKYQLDRKDCALLANSIRKVLKEKSVKWWLLVFYVYIIVLNTYHKVSSTICPRKLVHFHIASRYIRIDKTFWKYSISWPKEISLTTQRFREIGQDILNTIHRAFTLLFFYITVVLTKKN